MIRDILSKIVEKHQSTIDDESRNYIGASSIGSDCLRQIWYQFKGIQGERIPAKVRRIFDVGKKLELLVVDWLIEAGIKIERNNSTYVDVELAYFKGHFDGIITLCEKRAILEIKTAKDASFKIFVSKGVKVWNLQYYAQIQAYMGLSGIFTTYILALNKDNSDISDELVEFDPLYYAELQQKARMISEATIEPPRINGSPLWYQCKSCKFNKVCHQ